MAKTPRDRSTAHSPGDSEGLHLRHTAGIQLTLSIKVSFNTNQKVFTSMFLLQGSFVFLINTTIKQKTLTKTTQTKHNNVHKGCKITKACQNFQCSY